MSGRSERPRPPREPEPGECCGEGCPKCVLDVYEARLERYRTALEKWREHQRDPGSEGAQPGAGSTGVN